jgi:alpha-tubulin suppressor-like RCC1 family protein
MGDCVYLPQPDGTPCDDGVACTPNDQCMNGVCVATMPCNHPAYIAVAGSDTHACAIRANGSLWCWGDNSVGQIGDETPTFRYSPSHVGSATWTTIAANGSATCGVQTDGSLWCWGYDPGLRFGTGRVGDEHTPTRVGDANQKSWSAVAIGTDFGCGLQTDQSLWCWGNGNNGQLGGPVLGYRGLPRRLGSASWTRIAAGGRTACGIRVDGSLWCWGSNNLGQAGVGSATDPIAEPTEITAPADWKEVAVGDNHACAIDGKGGMWCWGDNSNAQLGDSLMVPKSASPVGVATGSMWTTVSSSYGHSCAISKTDGTLWCWGWNNYGVLGKPGGTATVPQQVDASTWKAVAAAPSNTCAIHTDGSLFCWGAGGALGNGDIGVNNASVPTAVSQNACTDGTATCTASERCAYDTTNGVTCPCKPGFAGMMCANVDECAAQTDTCGAHTACTDTIGSFTCPCQSGYVGDGNVCAPAFTRVALGDNDHACGIDVNQHLFCWGNDQYGQLGVVSAATPNAALQVGAATWLTVDAAGNYTCGIQTDHTLWCWGANNGTGTIGQPDTTVSVSTPTQVGVDMDWVEVATGIDHACARKSGGTIWCWGGDAYGALGIGNGSHVNVPTQVGTDTDWIRIAARWLESCGIRANDSLWCWGENIYGQVGAGGTPISFPQQILGGPPGGFLDVSLHEHTCGVAVDGTVWCWGRNDMGQLGEGDTVANPTPTLVLTGAVSVSAGTSHTCARKMDGTLWCWGDAQFSEVGDASDIEELVPVQSGYLTGAPKPARDGVIATDWVGVSAGNDSTCAVRADGTAWCWGSPYALGNGTGAATIIPVLVRE